jgi:hypothetical protein
VPDVDIFRLAHAWPYDGGTDEWSFLAEQMVRQSRGSRSVRCAADNYAIEQDDLVGTTRDTSARHFRESREAIG